MTATELKAKYLALLDEVDEKGDTVVVTKRGRAAAGLQPVKKKRGKDGLDRDMARWLLLSTVSPLDREP